MPHEDFDPQIEELAAKHERASNAMLAVVTGYLAGEIGYEAAKTSVEQIAVSLGAEGARWINENLPRIYADGVKQAQDALRSTQEAAGAPARADAHSASLRLFQEDLAADLAATTNRMSDDAKASLREIARRQLAEMMATGRNAIPQASEMREELEARGVVFTDRSGRRWKPRDYSRMVLRTHSVEVSNEANLSTAAELGSRGVRVFDGGSGDTDAPCVEAAGQYWSLSYAHANRLQHPNCRRAFSALPSTWQGTLDRE